MPKITFDFDGKINERFFNKNNSKKVTMVLEDESFTTGELFDEFMSFLQAIGYTFDDDVRLDLVKNEESKQTSDAVEEEQLIYDESGFPVGSVGPLIKDKEK